MKTVTYDDTKWRLVPVEPTEEMVSAGERSGFWGYHESSLTQRGDDEGSTPEIYREMLAAAPTPPDSADYDRRDAERYRWLRDSCGIVEYKAMAGSIGPGMLPSGMELEQAIDAAMAGEDE